MKLKFVSSSLFFAFLFSSTGFGQEFLKAGAASDAQGWGNIKYGRYGFFETIEPVTSDDSPMFMIHFRRLECERIAIENSSCSYDYGSDRVVTRDFNAYRCALASNIEFQFVSSLTLEDTYESFQESVRSYYVSPVVVGDRVVAMFDDRVTHDSCILIE